MGRASHQSQGQRDVHMVEPRQPGGSAVSVGSSWLPTAAFVHDTLRSCTHPHAMSLLTPTAKKPRPGHGDFLARGFVSLRTSRPPLPLIGQSPCTWPCERSTRRFSQLEFQPLTLTTHFKGTNLPPKLLPTIIRAHQPSLCQHARVTQTEASSPPGPTLRQMQASRVDLSS